MLPVWYGCVRRLPALCLFCQCCDPQFYVSDPQFYARLFLMHVLSAKHWLYVASMRCVAAAVNATQRAHPLVTN